MKNKWRVSDWKGKDNSRTHSVVIPGHGTLTIEEYRAPKSAWSKHHELNGGLVIDGEYIVWTPELLTRTKRERLVELKAYYEDERKELNRAIRSIGRLMEATTDAD